MVSIVAELTGYPPDLLDLDLDLEADLGVDTVKQAEVFAAVRQRFGVERDDTLSLRDFPTLTHVIGWILERTGQPPVEAPTEVPAEAAPVVPAEAGAEVAGGPSSGEVAEAVVSIVAELTGYPPDLLDLDLDLEADLGVDTVKQAEVFAAVRQRFGVERDDSLSLRDFPTLTHVIGWILERTGQSPAEAPAQSTDASRRPRRARPTATSPRSPCTRRRSAATWTRWTGCRGANPCRCCARRSTSASPPVWPWAPERASW